MTQSSVKLEQEPGLMKTMLVGKRKEHLAAMAIVGLVIVAAILLGALFHGAAGFGLIDNTGDTPGARNALAEAFALQPEFSTYVFSDNGDDIERAADGIMPLLPALAMLLFLFRYVEDNRGPNIYNPVKDRVKMND